jgi:hypothetical protein
MLLMASLMFFMNRLAFLMAGLMFFAPERDVLMILMTASDQNRER